MHFEILLKDDPLRVSSVSMFRRLVKKKITFENFTCQLFIISKIFRR